MANTYRIGSIRTNRGDHASYPRPLVRESDDRLVAIVDCEPGGLYGLTPEQVVERFGVRLPSETATVDPLYGIPYLVHRG